MLAGSSKQLAFDVQRAFFFYEVGCRHSVNKSETGKIAESCKADAIPRHIDCLGIAGL